MLKHQILFFLGFLALASALNATPEKNFFIMPPPNGLGLTTQLFQTRNGIIGYSLNRIYAYPVQLFSDYVLIDMETNNVTQILQDLPTACGQGIAAFDRLHYHVATYSLVYYCTNNNSILIIDPDHYNVQKVFSLNINETFQEVRITTDGYSVAILGLAGLFSQTPSPSHLIKLNLQTQTIANHIVFDHGLNSAEAVTAYASSGSSMFIITNIFNNAINIANVYKMTLISNSYSLTPLTTFNSSDYYTNTLPEFYCVENLIVTTNEMSLVILHQNGNILAKYEGLAFNEFYILPLNQEITFWRPAVVSDPSTSDVYVSLANDTLYKISAMNHGFNLENQGIAKEISIALKDQNTNSLLFAFTENFEYFTITDLAKSQVIYQTVSNFENFMITDKTYAATHILATRSAALYIFDRETNALIKRVPMDVYYYYDQENALVSHLVNLTNGTFQLEQIDLKTGNIYTPLSFDFPLNDSVQIIHATNNENFDGPQAVIHDITQDSDTFLIVSQTFGQAKLSVDLPQAPSFTSTLAVNYDTLTAFYFLDTAYSQNTDVTEYHYVASDNFFFSNNSNDDFWAGNIIPGSDYSIITTTGDLAVISMPFLNQTTYHFPNMQSSWGYFSIFQNSTSNFSMILSPMVSWDNQVISVGILYDNQIQDLPGATVRTVQAGVAAPCSYYAVNQVGSFGVVQFYNTCNEEIVSEIYA